MIENKSEKGDLGGQFSVTTNIFNQGKERKHKKIQKKQYDLIKMSKEITNKERFGKLDKILGYKFQNKFLLFQAFTSKSHETETLSKAFKTESNEYLGWMMEALTTLGDGVLNSKGEITNLKGRIVNNSNLSSIAKKIDLQNIFFGEKEKNKIEYGNSHGKF